MSDSAAVLDHVRVVSDAHSSSKASVLGQLLETRCCAEEDVLAAYEALANADTPSVVVGFQLPFVVRLPPVFFSFRTRVGVAQFRFRPIGAGSNQLVPGEPFGMTRRRSRYETEAMRNASLRNEPYGWLVRSQGLLLLEVTGLFGQHYGRYLDSLRSRRTFDSLLVRREESWFEQGALSGSTYEAHLGVKAEREAMYFLRKLIPRYALACRDPNATYYDWANLEWLDSPWVMVQSGRIIRRLDGPSLAGRFVEPFRFEDYSENLSRLQVFVGSGARATQYEEALLEAARLVEHGAPHLAVVHTAMILEWFATVVIRDRLPRPPKFRRAADRFAVGFPAFGVQLPGEMLDEIDHLIQRRNVIVHEKPSARAATANEARRAIEVASNVIQFSMNRLRENVNAAG